MAGILGSLPVVAACGTRSDVPGRLSAYLGTVLSKPVPADIANLLLTDDRGRTTSLAAMHGRIVVLADFLTLCQETCPLTTGNLLDMDRTVSARGLAGRVTFVEMSVDPTRDTPARLAAYRQLIHAPVNWSLLTGSQEAVNSIWRYFGIWFQKVPEGKERGVDWLTGRPLNYDVNHEDALIYLDAAGRERFLVAGAPNATGSPVPTRLRQFLSSQGQAALAHPDAGTWTASEALSSIAWLTETRIRPPSG
jgi:protein SCO1/2